VRWVQAITKKNLKGELGPSSQREVTGGDELEGKTEPDERLGGGGQSPQNKMGGI